MDVGRLSKLIQLLAATNQLPRSFVRQRWNPGNIRPMLRNSRGDDMIDDINPHFVDEDPLAPADRKKEKILDPLATMFAIQSLLPKYPWNNKQKAAVSPSTLPKVRRIGWRPNQLWNQGPNGVRRKFLNAIIHKCLILFKTLDLVI